MSSSGSKVDVTERNFKGAVAYIGIYAQATFATIAPDYPVYAPGPFIPPWPLYSPQLRFALRCLDVLLPTSRQHHP